MKRLGRWLFNFATVLSGVLCVAMAVIWGWSYWHTNTFSWDRDRQTSYFISSHRGRLEIARQSVAGNTGAISIKAKNPRGIDVSKLGTIFIDGEVQLTRRDAGTMQASGVTISVDPHALHHGFLGAGWSNPGLVTVFAIPDWALVVLFGGNASFAAWRLWRARLRPLVGHCPACGYDLRATPQRCPECGAIPAGIDDAARVR